jgi:hypothetical protein
MGSFANLSGERQVLLYEKPHDFNHSFRQQKGFKGKGSQNYPFAVLKELSRAQCLIQHCGVGHTTRTRAETLPLLRRRRKSSQTRIRRAPTLNELQNPQNYARVIPTCGRSKFGYHIFGKNQTATTSCKRS